MRIIQIIDSLEAGGAERMAVNYANALSGKIDFSGLVVTRKEGALLNQIDEKVSYLFLNKKGIIDFRALLKLGKMVKSNKVEVIHAHSTSFFLAFLLKLSCPSLRLIWHNHYGNSEFLSKKPLFAIRMLLPFFNGSIAVNEKLKHWAIQKIGLKNVIYLPNFPSNENKIFENTLLKGNKGKRVVLLANLRIEKNHFLLLDVAKKIKISHPEWSFHLVGKDFEDEYSRQIKSLIFEFDLKETVFVYGSKQDVENILEQSAIAVLTSEFEGLPVALLEYGSHKKAVVVTAVGEIPQLIQDGVNGFVVESGNTTAFYESLIRLMDSERLQSDLGKALEQTIKDNYSEEGVLKNYLNWLENIK